MYLYDINENICINLSKIISMKLDRKFGNIYFYFEKDRLCKEFSTNQEAREEYDRIKAMINDPPMLMSLDKEKTVSLIEKMRRK